jgi:hypothetical protein
MLVILILLFGIPQVPNYYTDKSVKVKLFGQSVPEWRFLEFYEF